MGGKIFKAGNELVNTNGGGHGPLGTHSVRKMASTHVRRSGALKDERDICGRGKERREFQMYMMMWSYLGLM